MSASARLAVSLSMATFVTRDSSLVCTPLQATIAKADLAQKQSMIQLGLATRLHVKEACPATQIAAEDADWHEMGLATAVRIAEPCPIGRRLSLPLRRRGNGVTKKLTFPPLGEAVQRVLQPGVASGRDLKPGPSQPSSEGRALAKWLRR